MNGDQHHTRRHDDAPLYDRIARLETHFDALDRKVNTLTLEQGHMLKLFEARFATVEKSQELMLAEVRGVGKVITEMASEAEKSPAGRSMLRSLEDIRLESDERDLRISEIKRDVNTLFNWKSGVEGAMSLLHYVGFGSLITGAAALIWVALRAMGKVP